MRFLILTLFCALFLCATSSCLPDSDDEQVQMIFKSLGEKFKDICAQGIKLGGEADISFVKQNILPYYISKKWLTKDPPNGWDKERENIISKCYNPTYNYCNPDHRKKSVDCLKDSNLATILMLKYGATAMAYCPILDKKIYGWFKSGDNEHALGLVTQYCATKGIEC